MRKLFLIPVLLASVTAEAAYQKRDHVVMTSVGGVLGSNELDEVKGLGPNAGLQYRYYTADPFSFGADVEFNDYGQHYNDEDETDVDVTLVATTLLARVDFFPRNEWASYLALGFGSHYIRQVIHEQPADRTESTGRGGYFIALGFEAPLKSKRWMWGGELRSIDPLGVSADSLALKATLSRRFGPEHSEPEPL
jgi:hypothetical protein